MDLIEARTERLPDVEAMCGSCGTPIFVVGDGDEDGGTEGPVWAHVEEVRCGDPDPASKIVPETSSTAAPVVELGSRHRRPPAALLLAAMMGLEGLGHPLLDLPPGLLPSRAPAPQRRRAASAAPVRELPEADKARRAAAAAKRKRRATKAREDAERSARGRGGEGA
jgi:pyruvate/2-oxoglutarate dehydrogenase complex dihydrolipoamide acyltransferase (E2) component